jgi:hypothetical protein
MIHAVGSRLMLRDRAEPPPKKPIHAAPEVCVTSVATSVGWVETNRHQHPTFPPPEAPQRNMIAVFDVPAPEFRNRKRHTPFPVWPPHFAG